jgi:hypothetical protein
MKTKAAKNSIHATLCRMALVNESAIGFEAVSRKKMGFKPLEAYFAFFPGRKSWTNTAPITIMMAPHHTGA